MHQHPLRRGDTVRYARPSTPLWLAAGYLVATGLVVLAARHLLISASRGMVSCYQARTPRKATW